MQKDACSDLKTFAPKVNFRKGIERMHVCGEWTHSAAQIKQMFSNYDTLLFALYCWQ